MFDWHQFNVAWNWLWESYHGAFGFALVMLAILLRKKAIRLLWQVLRKVVPMPKSIALSEDKATLLRPFDWMFVLLVAHLYLATRHELFYFKYLATIIRICYISLIGWGIVKVIQCMALQPGKATPSDHLPSLNQTMRSLMYRTLSILVFAFAVMMIIAELGYNMNGLLAGVGLGGLAIALAAQDMVANLFGCMVIVFDKPFELGDWISTPDLEGVVEDISFRSCRIRTFDDALVSVPNSKLANDMVTNWSKMNHRRLLVYIGVTYQTSQQQLEKCIVLIRKCLEAKSAVVPGSVHVYFHSMNSMNMDFRVQCNIYNKGFGPFLKIREEIHYDVLQIIREEEVSIASMPLFQEGLFKK